MQPLSYLNKITAMIPQLCMHYLNKMKITVMTPVSGELESDDAATILLKENNSGEATVHVLLEQDEGNSDDARALSGELESDDAATILLKQNNSDEAPALSGELESDDAATILLKQNNSDEARVLSRGAEM